MCEKILVVDDELFIRDSIADYLEDNDYTVDMAEDGEEALKKLSSSEYDLIITDLSMPFMGGMALIIKTNELYPHIPKIIVSGNGDMKDAIEAIRHGAYDYIVKPIETFDKLLISVKRALEKRKLTRNNIRYQKDLERTNKLLEEKIKELEETQSQLVQSAKMASLGVLAAGIAHEINNPNAFVNSNLQVLKNYMGNLKEFLEISRKNTDCSEELVNLKQKLKIDFILSDMENIIPDSLEGTMRIKTIVMDLKDFSRLDKPERGFYDLNSGIRSTLNILRNEIKKGINIIEDYGEIPEIKCHPGQLNQVFMNIIMNALQALPEEGGEVRIKTSFSCKEIIISVEDNGYGIEEGILSRIFDPFFTTKDVGKGMGLGLSLTYKIIEKHKGKIEVKSKPGEGTCFTIILPVEG